MENKSVKALEHFSLVPFSKLILNEIILIIFSISQRLESFAAHPLRITALRCRCVSIYHYLTTWCQSQKTVIFIIVLPYHLNPGFPSGIFS
jgi:hypothetical protein